MSRFQRDASKERLAEIMPNGISDAFALENLNWLKTIRDGAPLQMTGEEGTIDLALSYAILESGLLGRSVTLEEMLGGQVEGYQKEINEYYKL